MKSIIFGGFMLVMVLQPRAQSMVFSTAEIDEAVRAYGRQVIAQKAVCNTYLETLDSVISGMEIDKSLRIDFRRRLSNMGLDKGRFFDPRNDLEYFTDNEVEYLSRYTDFEMVPLVSYCENALSRLLYLKRLKLIDEAYQHTRNDYFLEQLEFYQLAPHMRIGVIGLENGAIFKILDHLEDLEVYANVMDEAYLKILQKEHPDVFIVYGQEAAIELEGLELDKIILGNIHRFKEKGLIMQSVKASLGEDGRLLLLGQEIARKYPRFMEKEEVDRLLQRHGFELDRERVYYEGRYYQREYRLN